MKKTLITLAALAMASVASAANGVANTMVDNPTGTLSGTYSAAGGDLTMIAVLDWDTVMGGVLEGYTWDHRANAITIGVGDGMWWQNSLSLFHNSNDSTKLEFGVATGDGSGVTLSNNSGYGDAGNITLNATDHTIDGKLTLAYTYTDGFVTISALKNDGTTWSTATATLENDTTATGRWDLSGNSFDRIVLKDGIGVDSLMVFDEALTGTALTYAVQTSIPEPTTATLSLLALAGLAARRRRK